MKPVGPSPESAPNLFSIRWRLPLTYAGIALLAALALGGLLLFTLRSYYDQREREYMASSADIVAISLDRLYWDREELPDDTFLVVAGIYSFAVSARVELLDVDGNVIADSASVSEEDFISLNVPNREDDPNKPPLGEPPDPPDEMGDDPGADVETYFSIRREEFGSPEDAPLNDEIARRYPLISWRSPFGRLLSGVVVSGDRNDLVVKRPIRAPGPDGELMGYVVLSEGPAFGSEIVGDVAEKAAVAGIGAVLLAAVAGWFASRNITRPVMDLTRTTGQMAEGDLSARVDLDRRDEFGLLAWSFNGMAERVETTVTTLRRFVADAAHEISTPITALRTNLELARATELPPDTRADIDQSLAELKRLEELTRSLLMLARLETPLVEMSCAPLDLGALMRQMHERYASRAEQAAITFTFEPPPAPPLIVAANRAQLIRVFDNVLDNALKFTPADGNVVLRATATPTHAVLSVCDTGIGIPIDDQAKLFSRFHRGRNAAAYPGNGLGLVITRAIVEDHGGTVRVESSAAGTEVFIELPLNGTSEGIA